jgi:hypothetical protein
MEIIPFIHFYPIGLALGQSRRHFMNKVQLLVIMDYFRFPNKLGGKEYIERRHGEPFKFLFLPKMGLLGSQAVLEKKVQF